MLPPGTHNIVGYSAYNPSITASSDWQLGKWHFDLEAAERVVAMIWTDKKTEALKRLFPNPADIVFITQPSTSIKNVIPIKLAEKLAKAFKAELAFGDRYFDFTHKQESKNIHALERVFLPRKYLPSKNINSLKERVKNKKVVLIEDVLTTGGSVSKFIESLTENEIKVDSVAALMGDKRLQVDIKSKNRLDAALQNINIAISTDQLIVKGLTRTEAACLTKLINNSRRKDNDRAELTKRIQGLFDRKVTASLGRDTESNRNGSAGRGDTDNARVSPRTQFGTVFGNSSNGGALQGVIEGFHKSVKEYRKKIADLKSFYNQPTRTPALTQFQLKKAIEKIQKVHLKKIAPYVKKAQASNGKTSDKTKAVSHIRNYMKNILHQIDRGRSL